MFEDDLDFYVVAETFYEILFREAPEIRQMFKDEGNKLSMMINALQSISDFESGDRLLNDFLETIGKQHRSLGISPKQMEVGWKAFSQAIEAGGKNLSPERLQFYVDVFSKLQSNMGYKSDRY